MFGLSNIPVRVHGAWVQGVVTNAISSEYSSGSDHRLANDVIGESGFFGSYHTSYPKGALWLNSATAGSNTAFITFDLGTVQPLQKIGLWNYNEAGITNRGTKTFNVSVAAADLVFTQVLANQTLNPASGVFTNNLAQYFSLGGAQARYVRIDILSNYGGSGVGLSKVRFINSSVAPTVSLVTRSYSGSTVTIRFSEPVIPASATNAANYSILNAATPVPLSSAKMDSFDNQVVLTPSTPLDSNTVYTLNAANVQAASDSNSITSTNITIAPQFVLWLKADAGVTADGNNFVSQWADQSGAGNNAIQTDPNSQPTLVINALNGKPAINFVNSATGTNEIHAPHTPSLVAIQDISFFVVLNPSSVVAYNSIISKCAKAPLNNFAAPFDYELSPTTGKARLLRGNDGSADTVTGNSNAVAGQTYLLELVIKGTNGNCYLNGFANGSALLQEGIADQGNPVRIGRRESGDIWMNGNIAEIMLIRGAVTSNEQASIETYLGRKYGLSTPYTGAPVISTQPTNIVAYAGYSTAFTVGISTSTGASPKTFQWYQTPGTVLAGQTNASLVLSNLTVGQDNTSYYVTVSNVDGSTNSDTATLNVLPVTAPYFTVIPQSQTVYIHQPATFTAQALGSPQLSYQWSLGNTPIVGATNNTLTVANASTNDAGNFTLSVSNNLGVTNATVSLTVLVPANGSYLNAVLTANPLLYYNFYDISSGTNTANLGSLGAAWNGSVQGAYSADQGPIPPSFPMFGSDNLSFGNATLTSGGVQFPPINLYNTNGGAHCTMAAWVYKDFGQTPFCGIIYARAAGNCGIGVNTVAGNDQLIYTWNGAQFSFNSGLYVPNSQWCFVAVVVSPTNAVLYLQDGSGMRTATNTVAAPVVPQLSGYVGWDAFGPTRRWYGDIDEPMIFDRALSSNQVSAIYSGTPITPTSAATLAIKSTGTNIVVTWPGGSGTLQRASNVTGPYSDMIGITSPYTSTASTNGFYYRLRVQ